MSTWSSTTVYNFLIFSGLFNDWNIIYDFFTPKGFGWFFLHLNLQLNILLYEIYQLLIIIDIIIKEN